MIVQTIIGVAVATAAYFGPSIIKEKLGGYFEVKEQRPRALDLLMDLETKHMPVGEPIPLPTLKPMAPSPAPGPESRWDNLYHAARYCDGNQVRNLLQKGHDANEIKFGDTPLLTAVENGCEDAVKALLEYGVKPDAVRGIYGRTALSFAVELKHISIVKLLLQYKADLNQISLFEERRVELAPLAWASMRGHINLARALLELNADINVKDKNGNAPLNLAVIHGSFEAAKLLLEHGADIESCNNDGMTPLLEAVKNDHIGNVKLLLDRKANVNAVNKSKESALIIAITKKRLSILKLLLENGADPNRGTIEDTTLLQHIIKSGFDIEVIKTFLEHGALVNTVDAKGATAFIAAAQSGNLELVKLLITHGADLGYVDSSGQTVLISAVRSGNIDLAKLLLDKGADPHVTDKLGFNALTYAAIGNVLAMVDLLTDKGVTISGHNKNQTLRYAAAKGSPMLALMLIKAEANVNSRDDFGLTPLMEAAKNGHLPVVQVLMEHDAALNLRDKEGKTALMMAVEGGHYEVASVLAKNPRCNILIQDYSGNSALSYARRRTNGMDNEFVELLEKRHNLLQQLETLKKLLTPEELEAFLAKVRSVDNTRE